MGLGGKVNSDLAASMILFSPEKLFTFRKCSGALNSMSHVPVAFPCLTLILH